MLFIQTYVYNGENENIFFIYNYDAIKEYMKCMFMVQMHQQHAAVITSCSPPFTEESLVFKPLGMLGVYAEWEKLKITFT